MGAGVHDPPGRIDCPADSPSKDVHAELLGFSAYRPRCASSREARAWWRPAAPSAGGAV